MKNTTERKTYRVAVTQTTFKEYEVEAASEADAKAQAEAMFHDEKQLDIDTVAEVITHCPSCGNSSDWFEVVREIAAAELKAGLAGASGILERLDISDEEARRVLSKLQEGGAQ